MKFKRKLKCLNLSNLIFSPLQGQCQACQDILNFCNLSFDPPDRLLPLLLLSLSLLLLLLSPFHLCLLCNPLQRYCPVQGWGFAFKLPICVQALIIYLYFEELSMPKCAIIVVSINYSQCHSGQLRAHSGQCPLGTLWAH